MRCARCDRARASRQSRYSRWRSGSVPTRRSSVSWMRARSRAAFPVAREPGASRRSARSRLPDIACRARARHLRDRSGIVEDAVGIYPITANLTGGERPRRVETLLVGENYFTLLGARPALGRLFDTRDAHPGIATVVVISDALWRAEFGADPDIVGRQVKIDIDPYTIVGVLPPGFRHPGRTLQGDVEVWAPTGFRAAPFGPPNRGAYFLSGALARLKPGITPGRPTPRTCSRPRSSASTRRYPERDAWPHACRCAPRRSGRNRAHGAARSPRGGGARPAPDVRERRQPAPGARVGAPCRDRGPPGDRGRARTAGEADADGEYRARGPLRRRRRAGRRLGDRSVLCAAARRRCRRRSRRARLLFTLLFAASGLLFVCSAYAGAD